MLTIQFGIMAKDALLVERQAPLGRQIGGDPAARRFASRF
jgi:hypothetical protein